MDTIISYRKIIKELINRHAKIKPAIGEIDVEAIFDESKDHYELSHTGWLRSRRVHGTVLHIDIRDGKVWIQHDGIEGGIAEELVEAGIPRDQIVLGFQPPSLRQYTEYAVA